MKDMNKNVTVNPETVATNENKTNNIMNQGITIEKKEENMMDYFDDIRKNLNAVQEKLMKMKEIFSATEQNSDIDESTLLQKVYWRAYLNPDTAAEVLLCYRFISYYGSTETHFDGYDQFIGTFNENDYEETLIDLCDEGYLTEEEIQGVNFEKAKELIKKCKNIMLFDTFDKFTYTYSEELAGMLIDFLIGCMKHNHQSLQGLLEDISNDVNIDDILFNIENKDNDAYYDLEQELKEWTAHLNILQKAYLNAKGCPIKEALVG